MYSVIYILYNTFLVLDIFFFLYMTCIFVQQQHAISFAIDKVCATQPVHLSGFPIPHPLQAVRQVTGMC